jgi:hypothetical protein
MIIINTMISLILYLKERRREGRRERVREGREQGREGEKDRIPESSNRSVQVSFC